MKQRRVAEIVAHIEHMKKDLEEQKSVIECALMTIETNAHALERVKTYLLTGVDTYERCARCGDPYFCHEKDGCSGEPHSGGHDDCNLSLFEPGGG